MESHPKFSPGVSSILAGSEFGYRWECAQCRIPIEVLRLGSHRNAEFHSGDTQCKEVSHRTNPIQLVLYIDSKG